MSIRPEPTEPSAQRNRLEITVEVLHSPPHSTPNKLFYIYFITIHNTGVNTVQLLRRHWDIRDGDGSEQVVDDEGVIGQQPVIAPGEKFIYNSGVPVRLPPGVMGGYYTLKSDTGEHFRADIPAFTLYVPEGWTASQNGPLPGRVLN
jgi:ApaG protein